MENRQRSIRKLLWRITAVLAILAVVSICFVSGTFARYVSNRSGSTVTEVAKWDIEFKNGTGADENNFTVTVGKLSPDKSEYGTLDDDDKQSAGDGYPGQRVKTTDAVLALQITNSGDVDATLTITPPEKNSLIFYGYAENGTDAAETAYSPWGSRFEINKDGTVTAPSLDEAREVITMQFALTTEEITADSKVTWQSLSELNLDKLILKAAAQGSGAGGTAGDDTSTGDGTQAGDETQTTETSVYYFYVRSVWTSRDEYYYQQSQQNQQTAAAMSDGLDTWLGEHIAAVGAAFTFSVVQASELPT